MGKRMETKERSQLFVCQGMSNRKDISGGLICRVDIPRKYTVISCKGSNLFPNDGLLG